MKVMLLVDPQANAAEWRRWILGEVSGVTLKRLSGLNLVTVKSRDENQLIQAARRNNDIDFLLVMEGRELDAHRFACRESYVFTISQTGLMLANDWLWDRIQTAKRTPAIDTAPVLA